GDYIERYDPRYATQWTTVTMVDDGTGGDEFAGDDRYTVVLPGTMQTHRRLVRYRITVADTFGATVQGPYADDDQPNFAYYVYDGVPSWTGSITPGGAETTYSSEVLTSVATYQLLTTQKDHVDSQHIPNSSTGTYGGSSYLWQGALVYDGVVYDHINYRARGGVWRYAMGKNMWKFDFNRGHYFQARDDYGNPYDTKWDKLNFSALIQQGNFAQRGEQGLFEGAGFALHNLAGNFAPKTNYAQFRIVENAAETGADQYSGDFQGLYMVIEQPDGRLLDEHGLPDGNFYKMEGGTGTLNNQGPDQPTNKSDLNTFINTYKSNPTQQWWEDNLDLEEYYSFRAMAMAVHDYDIHAGKNYFYYHNPETDKWSVMNWDLDLCWTTTYGGGGGTGPLNDYVFRIPQFQIDYNSRVRELVDLVFNPEQTGMLLDETASFVNTPGQPSVVDADRAMWDYNPILTSGYVNSSKAGHGRYYESAPGRTFEGMVAYLKNYVAGKVNSYLAGSPYAFDPKVASDEGQQPDTPVISYVGPEGFPLDELRFQSSAFSGGSETFAAMKWRIAEVTDPNDANFDPTEPRKYEATAHWESDDITTFGSTMVIPTEGLEAGKTYRVRVRMQDSDGRWSHWSDPVQLVASSASGSPGTGLRITEIMYHPSAVTPDELAVNDTFDRDDFEFIELTNTTGTTLDLNGVSFSAGISFDFAANNVISLAPNEIIVLARNIQAFQARYGTEIPIAGQFDDGKLADGGEQITLVDSYAQPILDFTYDDADPWPGRADGNGSSIEVLNTAGDYDDGENWRSSAEYDGSPGTAGIGWLGDVVVNEVLTHTDPPLTDPDSIELFNTTGADIAIGGWYLSDSTDNYKKYRIPDGTILYAGSYLVFDEGHFNPTPESPGLNDFALNGAHGDDVYLTAAEPDGTLTRFVDHVDFGAAINGESFGRWPNGSGDLYPMIATSLGDENSGPRVGPILISEVHYNPGDTAGSDDLEFIELFNPTSEAVDLTNWRIRKGIDFDFAPDTMLESRSTLVVVSFDPADPLDAAKLAAFYAEFSIDDSVLLVGPFAGRLGDGGEKVQLQRPDEPPAEEPGFIPRLLEDEVIYDDTSPWPTEADGRGSSLHRVDVGSWGNSPASWTAADPSPGTNEIELPAAEVIGRHVFYNNSQFDGLDAAANAADDAAIATDKQALLAGEVATSA
ncbi:MAG TPA: lamin tail domain-containing protein, partial [Thermoguttaceae bacterium]|nr:lamin tail domain-containing protein [Thermoguttaceae bacterium]